MYLNTYKSTSIIQNWRIPTSMALKPNIKNQFRINECILYDDFALWNNWLSLAFCEGEIYNFRKSALIKWKLDRRNIIIDNLVISGEI